MMKKHNFDLTYTQSDYVDRLKHKRINRIRNAYNEIENNIQENVDIQQSECYNMYRNDVKNIF